MARKKKAEKTVDELVEQVVPKAVLEDQPAQETETVEETATVSTEQPVESDSTDPEEPQTEKKEIEKENVEDSLEEIKEKTETVGNRVEENLNTDNNVQEKLSEQKEVEENEEVEEDSDDVESFVTQDIPKEILQQEKESFTLDNDTTSFEDFQKSIKTAGDLNVPFLIQLKKGDPVHSKFSVGLKTQRGTRILAHKLSKEKAENYISNFLRGSNNKAF